MNEIGISRQLHSCGCAKLNGYENSREDGVPAWLLDFSSCASHCDHCLAFLGARDPQALGVSSSGTVVGDFVDSNDVVQGFVFTQTKTAHIYLTI